MEKVKDRRNFLLWFGLTSAALAVGLGSAVSSAVGSVVSNLWDGGTFKAGRPETFTTGKVDGRWKDKHSVWMVRSLDGLYALCALSPFGCMPCWIEKEQKFHCDCHGKSYYKSGISFQGAAEKSLERLKITRDGSGEILINKSKKFLLEKGDWQRPYSILTLP